MTWKYPTAGGRGRATQQAIATNTARIPPYWTQRLMTHLIRPVGDNAGVSVSLLPFLSLSFFQAANAYGYIAD